MGTYRTVVQKGDPLQKEAQANAAITPGYLIERMSTGKVRAHATQGGNQNRLFAIENFPDEATHAYEADEQVQFVAARPGDEIAAVLKDGESVSIGGFLESNGDGTLKAYTATVESSGYSGTEYPNKIVGVALETLDLSATTTLTDTQILIEVI